MSKIDIVGIINKYDFRDVETRKGKKQTQAKLIITDGRFVISYSSFGMKLKYHTTDIFPFFKV